MPETYFYQYITTTSASQCVQYAGYVLLQTQPHLGLKTTDKNHQKLQIYINETVCDKDD